MCGAVSALSSPLAARGTCRRVVTPAARLFLLREGKEGHWNEGEESAKRKETEGGPWDRGFCNPRAVLRGRLRSGV